MQAEERHKFGKRGSSDFRRISFGKMGLSEGIIKSFVLYDKIMRYKRKGKKENTYAHMLEMVRLKIIT